MTPNPGTRAAARTGQFAWWDEFPVYQSALTVQTPAQALGFPRTNGGLEAAAAKAPLALLPMDEAAVQDGGGFEYLPVALVSQIVIAYLGAPGWVEIKNLAQRYPGFRNAIGDAVDSDPMFQVLGQLVAPMRAIALRDLLEALARREPYRQRLSSQSALAQNNLRSRTWLPFVEQLVQQRVNGVRPEHTELLALCDRMLAGHMLHDSRDMDSAVASAIAIGLKGDKWRKLMVAANCHELGVAAIAASRLGGDIALYRRDVLGTAFAGIASAFAAQAGWSFDELMAESQINPVERAVT
jgi:hypothetical protein